MKKLSLIGVFVLLLSANISMFGSEEAKQEVADAVKDTVMALKDTSAAAIASLAKADSLAKVEEEKAKAAAAALAATEEPEVEKEIHQVIKEKMIEGGVEFMGIVLLCLIIGLTVAIERVITLNLATTNTKKLLGSVKNNLFNDGIESARESISGIRGPIAGIFAQGLLRLKNGETTGDIENSIVNHGSAEMSKLEKGLSWINLFISLAPMFGFMGTVIGMIQAFDDIQATGEMEIGSVAGGIKVALLTTVAGLVVAIILQIFYNYCVSKIEDLSSDMEDSSNSFMDIVSKYKRENNL